MEMLKAMKVETEAEGASRSDFNFYRRAAHSLSVPLHVKIGGVEAVSDIKFLHNLGVDGLIAPMVESRFAAEKFFDATDGLGFEWRALTIESETAVANLQPIIELAIQAGVTGITIGRGDLAASLGKKGEEDSDYVLKTVADVATIVNEAGIRLTIGGNMQISSVQRIIESGILFDALETRRFTCVPKRGTESSEYLRAWSEALDHALSTEIGLLSVLNEERRRAFEETSARLKLLEARLGRSSSSS